MINAAILKTVLFVCAMCQIFSDIASQRVALKVFYSSDRETDIRKKLIKPTAMAVARSGNVYIFDSGNERIVKLSPDGDFLAEFGTQGGEQSRVYSAGLGDSLFIDQKENVYVIDPVAPMVKIFTSSGNLLYAFRVPFPMGDIAVDSTGKIFLAATVSRAKSLVYTFDRQGRFLSSFGERLIPSGGVVGKELNRVKLTVDASDNLYLAFRSWPLVRKYSVQGKLLSEESYPIPTEFRHMIDPKTYSLDFLSSHADQSYVLPLLVFASRAAAKKGIYLLLNGGGVVKLDEKGKIVKETLIDRNDRRDMLLVSFAVDAKHDRILLLDTAGNRILYASRASDSSVF